MHGTENVHLQHIGRRTIVMKQYVWKVSGFHFGMNAAVEFRDCQEVALGPNGAIALRNIATQWDIEFLYEDEWIFLEDTRPISNGLLLQL